MVSLRDDLFLLAHDDSGRLVIAETHIGVGLAGAVLIGLLLERRVEVREGRLTVVDGSPTGDADIDITVETIDANTEPCGPRAWVSWIAHGAYERVADALVASGAVRRRVVRRLGLVPVTRYQPTNPHELVRVRARLRYAVHGRDLPDPETAALCGLVRVLRLESALLLNMPTSELLLALERMTAANDGPVRQVTNAVEAVIASALYR